MKHWGVAISVLYAVVVVALTTPLAFYLAGEELAGSDLLALFDPAQLGDSWWLWAYILLFVSTQAALLLISVDVSGKRLKARRRLTAAVSATTFAVGLMSFALISSVMVAFLGDDLPDSGLFWLGVPAGLWIVWGIVFFVYRERLSEQLTQTVGWLLNGSVLQLLVAVPAHVAVRERNDCCAPMISGSGIATGVALMLMAFGPSVVFLYQDRLRRYERRSVLPLLARWPVWTLLATLVIGGAILLWLDLHAHVDTSPAFDLSPLLAPPPENP